MINNSTPELKQEIILNGPLNYIELYCDKTEQTLWLFMDTHKNIIKQKKCDEYEAKDIDKFFYKVLNESNELIDFFLEINPTDITKENKFYKNENYIMEIRKKFKKIYHEKQITKKNNIRLHYIDIRDYAFYNEIILIIINIINDIDNNKLSNLDYIIGELSYISEILIFINKLIYDIVNEKISSKNYKIDIIRLKLIYNTELNNKINNIMDLGFIQLLEKIILKYSNSKNKQNIFEYFNSNYIMISVDVIKYIDDIIINLKDIQKLLNHQIEFDKLNIDKFIIDEQKKIVEYIAYYGINETEYVKMTRILYDQIIGLEVILLKLGSVFMDSFFLRRIIEKNEYIKKSIIYTGGYHTIVYIWFLVKFYDFKIKDYYYLNSNYFINKSSSNSDNNIQDKINNFIKNSNSYNELFDIFFPSKFNQCIKIKKFV